MEAIGPHAALGTEQARFCKTLQDIITITVAVSSTAVSRCLAHQRPISVASPNGHFVVQLDYAPQSCLFSGAALFGAI